MKRVFTLILLAFAVPACWVAAPQKKPTTTSPSTAAKAVHKPTAASASAHTVNHPTSHTTSKTHPASTANAKYVRGRRDKRGRLIARSAPGPSYQLHPDPERYQQIQQALSDKGYFKGDVNGQWGDDSVDALKRFQADQKLDDDGHLSALTLIGLGLGPKHDHDVSAPATTGPNVPTTAPKTDPAASSTPTTSPAGSAGPPPLSSAGSGSIGKS
ncbi:MAG TPA: peptidoglycan-binding protein [Bryobacteraceae bacterium]|nr:peptidoglycan-binding protein [Bryobacteraceae bacterium]